MNQNHVPIDRERLDEMLRIAPFHRWLDLKIRSVTRDQLEIEMPWRDEIVSNPMIGSAHGGVLASLIDNYFWAFSIDSATNGKTGSEYLLHGSCEFFG